MKMNPIFIVTIIAVAAVFFFAFKGVTQNSCFENVNVEAFASKMNPEAKDVVIIDVRTPSEVSQGAIKGAVNINVNDRNFLEQINKLDKEKTYLVYCRSGARSARACTVMCNNGFQKLFNLQGGFMAWSRSKK
jgi:rhodanese-related sulfurtransferase